MSRWTSCCCTTILMLLLSAPLVIAHDFEDCCRYCKKVSDACKEGRSTDCEDKYDTCMQECPQRSLKDRPKGDEATPDTEKPKTNIPEIPDPKKLEELKQPS